jgi:hypothetical protein
MPDESGDRDSCVEGAVGELQDSLASIPLAELLIEHLQRGSPSSNMVPFLQYDANRSRNQLRGALGGQAGKAYRLVVTRNRIEARFRTNS